ncbi:putative sporulation protein YtxC [Rossellomorea sp. BNER]|uniref:putative sporulation protein YtxC n=1 Tax=Rossellomorea sp. BNER TaxID=2962031 RepID=UPI003AF278E4|nr:putative sporulation protein YtxC [Rossellomorea sp. BNER]
MFEIIFKHYGDAANLKKYLEVESCQSWLHETLFQQQKHYVVSIDQLDENVQSVVKQLAMFILNSKRLDWASTILSEFYLYNDPHEQEQILQIMIEMFNGERPELVQLLKEWDEEQFLYQNLEGITESNGPVSFDSFVKFRLKKLEERTMEYVDIAIDEYKMEQDYQMFIHMLREYLSSRENQIDIIHLYFSSYGFTFYNEFFEELTREKLLTLIDKRLLTNHPLYVDSYTIAPLLSLAPEKILVYCDQPESNLIRTIQNIFEERVQILPSCSFPLTIGGISEAVNE